MKVIFVQRVDKGFISSGFKKLTTAIGGLLRRGKAWFKVKSAPSISHEPQHEELDPEFVSDFASASTQVKLHKHCKCSLQRVGDHVIWQLGDNPCGECSDRAVKFNSKWHIAPENEGIAGEGSHAAENTERGY